MSSFTKRTLTFLFRVFSSRWNSNPIPSSTGEGGPSKKSCEWDGELERAGEFAGLGKCAISDPESGVKGNPKFASAAEKKKKKILLKS